MLPPHQLLKVASCMLVFVDTQLISKRTLTAEKDYSGLIPKSVGTERIVQVIFITVERECYFTTVER